MEQMQIDPFVNDFDFLDDIHGPINLNLLERDVVIALGFNSL